jgi:hypothetical protein
VGGTSILGSAEVNGDGCKWREMVVVFVASYFNIAIIIITILIISIINTVV